MTVIITKNLEDHLEEICPICKKIHESNWIPEFEHFKCYKKQKCSECGYVLFKKLDFTTDGSFLF